MAYNPWYSATYRPLLDMADWRVLTADLERKVIGIFSWMPTTIVSVKHAGNVYKWEMNSVASIRAALEPMQLRFAVIRREHLRNFVISRHEGFISNLFDAVAAIMGPVAASKFLHFSAPQLLPMWDNAIRINAGCEATGAGYIHYTADCQRQLRVRKNYQAAIERCPDNVVRGWDMVCMERRSDV